MDNAFLNIIIPLLMGYLLDLIFGDPHWFPHPVKGFGWLIAKGEKIFNHGNTRFLKGAMVSIFLILLIFSIVFYIRAFVSTINIYCIWVFDSIMIYFCIANKSLIDEGKAVFKDLEQDIDAGRKRLSWIVGRDTANLSENQIRIAVFETMSENLSDGVIAPLFFYAIGGVPAMIAYKMTNTLDSMIGYKNERYEQFGKFAARVDDVANYIPARITAFLIAFISANKRAFQFILRYGNKHSSPNSGFPEAAMAGVLDCRFGGPNSYHGLWIDKPYIGQNNRAVGNTDLFMVIKTNQRVTFTGLILIILINYYT